MIPRITIRDDTDKILIVAALAQMADSITDDGEDMAVMASRLGLDPMEVFAGHTRHVRKILSLMSAIRDTMSETETPEDHSQEGA